jgi:HJR/Mrr/RecB family endonuclease
MFRFYKRKKEKKKESYIDIILDIVEIFLPFYFIYLFSLFFTNKNKFVLGVLYGLLFFLGLVFLILIIKRLKKFLIDLKIKDLIKKIKEQNQEEYILNFINRFGFEGKNKYKNWSFRDYSFDWDRINDFIKILKDKGIISKNKDVFLILKYYIQQKEEELTRESILKGVQKFSSLNGYHFEKLLYRLFAAIGYQVQLVGKVGDQGGDLILNKNGERILVQAKCFRDWKVGNKAIQEAVAAKNYYNCNKAIVVTTSDFTSEAIELAKVNNVDLISKKYLQELLLKYLDENWE